MKSFHEYLTDGSLPLLRFLAKERVKLGAKGVLKDKSSETEVELWNSDPMLIKRLMPPRNRWVRLWQSTRCKKFLPEERNELAILKTVRSDIRKYRDNLSEAPDYLVRLLDYMSALQDMAAGTVPISFSENDLRIIPKFKEDSGDDAVYRPLSVYTCLTTKILISAASEYLTRALDGLLHEEILSYRPARNYHGRWCVTTGADAVKGAKEYLRAHFGQNIYVAECDVQKFYDIINHDVVLDCFDRMAEKAGIPDYWQVRAVLSAYLDSYGFVPNVLKLNDDASYWGLSRKNHCGVVKGKFYFKWVREQDFMDVYTEEEYGAVRERLGVPQGGALSCVISNVVLNDVDMAVLSDDDPDRFFVRYGDDMLLMHTDKEKCIGLLERYKDSLRKHRLVYHPFEDFAGLKDGERNTKAFWKGKSKPVFLWGYGEGAASEWIGFVGYEIGRKGHTRLRLSTLDKKFGAINKKYHKCLERSIQNPDSLFDSCRQTLEGISSSMDNFTELNMNTSLAFQLRSLDRYRHKKIKKLDSHLERKTRRKLGLTEYFEEKSEFSFYESV